MCSPSHSAVHEPLPPTMRGRPSCSLPEGQPKPVSQTSPQLRSSRITLHRHVCLHMLILWLDIACQAKEAGGQPIRQGLESPSPSCICMVSAKDWGLCPLDASQLTGSGNARRRRGHSKLDGPGSPERPLLRHEHNQRQKRRRPLWVTTLLGWYGRRGDGRN